MANVMRTRRTDNRMIHAANRQRGFTLIELLIVVAIILIIASISIPSLLRSRIAANESAAVSDVRAITTAATAYSTQWSNGYPPSFAAMGGSGIAATCDAAVLLDSLLTTPPNLKAGYIFAYTAEGPAAPIGGGCSKAGSYGYLVTAVPSNSYTGHRSFCSDLPAVIHYDATGAAISSVGACDALPAL
jgi:type IV pilus assembly protein PilA